jgi:hypothetical protein
MDTLRSLNQDVTLQPGFQSRPAPLDDLEATERAVEANLEYLFGTQAELLDNMRREWQEPGYNLETDTQKLVLYEKELRPGLDTHAQSLEGGGP